MKGDVAQHLYDIQQAGTAIKKFVAGRTLDDYVRDEMLRSSIERKFEIIGGALNRITRDSPQDIEHIRGYHDVISFRNILVHGNDSMMIGSSGLLSKTSWTNCWRMLTNL